MKRKIIHIDREKCNGCGECIPNCPEGAIQIIDGKAVLVSDRFCDGLGACLGHCPVGAITTVEREAEPYDERRVMENIMSYGENTIRAHMEHLESHGETELLETAKSVLREKGIVLPEKKAALPHFGGCPGSRTVDRRREAVSDSAGEEVPSELRQWPVQLALIHPGAQFFDQADLLIAADCVAFAMGNFHSKLLKGKVLVMFCPKLDQDLAVYQEKLTEIFRTKNIRSVTVAHMQVPCCFGTRALVERALAASGKDIPLNVRIVSIEGQIIG